MTSEAAARERRQQREQEVTQWFRDACAAEDATFDRQFDAARDNAVRLRAEAQAAHSKAAQAQLAADALRRRPRPAHTELIAERDRRLQQVDDDFNGEVARLLGNRGFSTSHWRH